MHSHLSSSKVVVHNAFFNLLGFLVSAVYLFFLVPIVVHHLGMEEYGLWSLVLALSGYMGLADAGLSMSFVKFIAEYAALQDYERLNKVIQHGLLFYALVGIVILGAGFAVFPVLASLLKIPGEHYTLAQTTFLLALVSMAGANFGAVFGSVLTGLQRMDVYNSFVAGVFIVKFILILAVLRAGFGLVGIMLAEIGTTLLAMGPLVVVTKQLLPQMSFRFLGYDWGIFKRLLWFGSQMQVSRFAEMIQLQYDKLLLSRFIGLPAVSMYDFGSRPLGRLRALPLTAVASLVPAVSALDAEENQERIKAALLRATRYVIVFALPLFSFIIVFAHEIITLWLDAGYAQAATALQILSVGYFVNVVSAVLAFVSHGKGEPRFQMRAMVLQVGFNVILSTALLLQFGFFGAVCGTTLSMIAGAAFLVRSYGKQFFEKPLLTFAQLCGKPLLSVVPSLLGAKLLTAVVSPLVNTSSQINLGVLLAVTVVVFLTAYVGMLTATRTFTADDKGFVAGVVPDRLKHLLRFL